MEINPAEDREEFERRLDVVFDPMEDISIKECILKLIQKDQIFSDLILEKIEKNQLQKDRYLKEWDAASTLEDKMKVVGSVTS